MLLPALALIAPFWEGNRAQGPESSATQGQPTSQTGGLRGTITGHVVTDSGQPIAHILVSLSKVGTPSSQRGYQSATDDTGRFKFSNLPDVAYRLAVRVPGYTRVGTNEQTYYRIGESAMVTMTSGGVITGSVRDAAGEPVVNALVRALLVRRLEGGPPSVRSPETSYKETDDRGVYRLYGLAPGIYLVTAKAGISSSGGSKNPERAPTFYSSSGQASAEEISVQSGQEITGIDITYRDEPGSLVSGAVSSTAGIPPDAEVTIMLTSASSGVIHETTTASLRGNGGFVFHGIPNGEYFLIARLFPSGEVEHAASQPRRLTIKGAAVTGLKLVLSPMAVVSGRVVLEQPVLVDKVCMKASAPESTVITLQRDAAGGQTQELWDTGDPVSSPDTQGIFNLYNLTQGRYRIGVNLPNPCWFTKSITTDDPSRTRRIRAPIGKDLAETGIEVSSGSGANRVKIVLADGAAMVSGRVVLETGRPLPPDLYAYLIPTGEASNVTLRFSQTPISGMGDFLFTNVAPGKYLLLARKTTGRAQSRGPERARLWNIEERSSLRKDALAAGIPLELRPYQRVTGFSLLYRTDLETDTKPK